MTATLTVNLHKLACNWCEADNVPAPHRVTVDGWTDYVCTAHLKHFPELTKINNDSAGTPETIMASHDAIHAALNAIEADAQHFRGFGVSEAEAMRDAIESRRVEWHCGACGKPVACQCGDGPTWQDITADAKRAGILTFKRTPHGVLALDEN